jgi:hypothetical protein
MTDHVNDTIEMAQLGAAVATLRRQALEFYLISHGLDRQIDTLDELVRHPPPHPDPAQFRQHISGRIEEIRNIIAGMGALLPPELRSKLQQFDFPA